MDSKTLPSRKGYQEAETVSIGSEKSSLLEFYDLKLKENPYREGLFTLKSLVEGLETSLLVSNAIDNSLLLKCALLEAENQNLKHYAGNMSPNFNLSKKENRKEAGNEKRDVSNALNCEKNETKQYMDKTKMGVKKLEDTISYLEGELKGREKTIGLVCEKYLYLKRNKNRMEVDLKKKIWRLERLLKVTYEILQEVRVDVENKMEKYLSKTKDIYEALFLQEKRRCNNLMYENVRLQHEIQKLEDNRRKCQSLLRRREVANFVDKCTSEPVMRFT